MSSLMGVAILDGELRQVPKLGLTVGEVGFAIGSIQVVNDLRKIRALIPAKKHGKTLLFDANHVAEVWTRYCNGEFDAQMHALPGGERKRRQALEADLALDDED